MVKSYKKDLLGETQDRCFDSCRGTIGAYLQLAQNHFDDSDAERRNEILEGLGRIVGSTISELVQIGIAAEEVKGELRGGDGGRAREIREENGLSQESLADILGVSQKFISITETYLRKGYKRGQTDNIRRYFEWLVEHGYEGKAPWHYEHNI